MPNITRNFLQSIQRIPSNLDEIIQILREIKLKYQDIDVEIDICTREDEISFYEVRKETTKEEKERFAASIRFRKLDDEYKLRRLNEDAVKHGKKLVDL